MDGQSNYVGIEDVWDGEFDKCIGMIEFAYGDVEHLLVELRRDATYWRSVVVTVTNGLVIIVEEKL